VAALLAIAVFAGGVAFLGRGKTTPAPVNSAPPAIALSCIGGSEKTSLLADPEVTKILRDTYGIAVSYTPMSSYDQVLLSDADIASRGADCLWPSSVSAQYVFEAKHKTSTYPGYRAETVLQSPEVIYAGPEGTSALEKAGIVQRRGNNTYYIVDLKRLLVDYVRKGAAWNSLAASTVAGPIQISSTDPAKSNSGFTLYQLLLTVLATDNVYQAPDVAQARAALPTLRAIYDKQGLQARSSDAGFEQWLLQGGESHAPLYAGYESQIIQKFVQYSGNASAKDLLTQQVRVLYPEPTIYSDHPILALNSKALAFITAMKDPKIQEIAWRTYGFRSGTQLGITNVADFPQLPLAQKLRTTTPPNAAVTDLLLRCVRDNVCR
jgi:hypothetical protein